MPAALGLFAAAAFAVGRRGPSEEEKFEEKRLARLEERRKRAFIEPKKAPWTADELRRYDGSRDEDGPILLACAGLVFNVWKGAHFYAPGCAYHTLAGRDATRLLAKNSLEEETDEEAKEPLSLVQEAALQGWLLTLKAKYEVVGTYEPT